MTNDRLLTARERKAINDNMPTDAKYGDVFGVIAEFQDGKTLKAVGEWLENRAKSGDNDHHGFWVMVKDVEALKQGRMPE